MLTSLIALVFAALFAFIDLLISRICMQPFILCTLAFYIFLLYTKNPFKRLSIVFFVLMLLAHFLYGNELRLFWYLIPLTLAGAYGQRLRFSKRYQPFCLALVGMITHRLIIDHIAVQNIVSWDCTTFFSIATLILLALFSLK